MLENVPTRVSRRKFCKSIYCEFEKRLAAATRGPEPPAKAAARAAIERALTAGKAARDDARPELVQLRAAEKAGGAASVALDVQRQFAIENSGRCLRVVEQVSGFGRSRGV